jgi:hypothetical protein
MSTSMTVAAAAPQSSPQEAVDDARFRPLSDGKPPERRTGQ